MDQETADTQKQISPQKAKLMKAINDRKKEIKMKRALDKSSDSFLLQTPCVDSDDSLTEISRNPISQATLQEMKKHPLHSFFVGEGDISMSSGQGDSYILGRLGGQENDKSMVTDLLNDTSLLNPEVGEGVSKIFNTSLMANQRDEEQKQPDFIDSRASSMQNEFRMLRDEIRRDTKPGIGINEEGKDISFIKKEGLSSFGGSWLDQEKMMPEAEKYRADQPKQEIEQKIVGDSNLLAALQNPELLYKDVEAEEFDLEDDELDDKILKKYQQDLKEAYAAPKFERISEKDEENSDEEDCDEVPKRESDSRLRYESLEENDILRIRNIIQSDQVLSFGEKKKKEGGQTKPTLDINLEIEIPDLDSSKSKDSNDSVDRLWKQALDEEEDNIDDFTEKMTSEHEYPGIEGLKESLCLEEQENLRRKNQEELERHQMELDHMISFTFPSTDPRNQANISLAHYPIYLHPANLNLAPSTDSRLTFLMSQMTWSNHRASIELFTQELGTIGYYGIKDDEETLLSIILLTNYSEIYATEIGNQKTIRQNIASSFNNVQQYLVPDAKMNHLKKTLKKIIQTMTKDFGMQSQDIEAGEDDPLGALIQSKTGFGELLLLGKLYFHACKFKQSLYSLNMSLRKCKAAPKPNKSNLQQSLLWLVMVNGVYLFNRIRILSSHKAANKKGDNFYIGCVEIFDIIRDLHDFIQQFLESDANKKNNMRTVVLFVQLKLRILKQSDLYREIVQELTKKLRDYELEQTEQAQLELAASQIAPANSTRRNTRRSTVKGLFGKQSFAGNAISNSAKQSFAGNTKINQSTYSTKQSFAANMQVNQSAYSSRQSSINGQDEIDNGGALMKSMIDPNASKTQNQLMGKLQLLQEQRAQALGLPKKITNKRVLQTLIGEQAKDKTRREDVYKEERDIENTTTKEKQTILRATVSDITASNSYVGKVAETEITLFEIIRKQDNTSTWLGTQQYTDPSSVNSIQELQIQEADPLFDQLNMEKIWETMQTLEEVSVFNPLKILAPIKLWQFYRTLGLLLPDEMSEQVDEAFEKAFRVVERLEFSLPKLQTQFKSCPEKRILIILMNSKSLFGFYQFNDCFQLLQREYLLNSQYAGLLYLYGKYIVKSNQHKYLVKCKEQEPYFGSGVGALEECLKQCMPEYQSRINYYIGIAYTRTRGRMKMPFKSLSFFQTAKSLSFNIPLQGRKKMQHLSKILKNYEAVQEKMQLIDQLTLKKEENKKLTQAEKEEATMHLTTIEYLSKLDKPSCLLLKAHIYSSILNQEEEANKCYQELIDSFPNVIQGYLSFWNFTNQVMKRKKERLRYFKWKHSENITSAPVEMAILKEQKAIANLLSQIKSITQKAIFHSNSCTQATTAEWVNVRIMAAKTYLIEKKVIKATNILTDLCFVIPPNMISIGEDCPNLVAQPIELDRPDNGGIRFCKQVIADIDEESEEEEQDELMYQAAELRNQEEKKIDSRKFMNTIILQQNQEKELQDDFFETSADQENYEKQIQLLRQTANDGELFQSLKVDPIDLESSALLTQSESKQENVVLNEYMESKNDWDVTNFEIKMTDQQADEQSLRDSLAQSLPVDTQSRDSIPKQRPPAPALMAPRAKNVVFEINKDQFDSQYSLAKEKPAIVLKPSLMNRESLHSFKGFDSRISNSSKKKFGQKSNLKNNVARACSISTSLDVPEPVFHPKPLASIRNNESKKFKFSDKKNVVEESGEKRRCPSLVETKEENPGSTLFDQDEFNQLSTMVMKKRQGMEDEDEVSVHEEQERNTIFAVYSDVQFLQIIGKMCAQSGHNLYQGLQALNDYYLMNWHYGDEINKFDEAMVYTKVQNEEEGVHKEDKREGQKVKQQSTLTRIGLGGAQRTEVGKVKECIKTLFCIAQIYEQLSQPALALKYYNKILEDMHSLNKYYDCQKYVLRAQNGMSNIYKSQIVGNTIDVLSVKKQQPKSKWSKLEGEVKKYSYKAGDMDQLNEAMPRIIIDQNYIK